MQKELICIRCPIGCRLSVTVGEDGITVSGNSCPRGAEYGKKEVTDPTRTVTGSVRISGGEMPLLSVKTASDVPKDKVGEVMAAIRNCRAEAPVSIGSVILKDAAGTGVDIVATRTVRKA